MKKIYLSGVWMLLGMVTLAQTWNGVTNKNWNTPTNWSPEGVPVGTSDVTIPGGLTNYPILGNNTTINSIQMLAGSELDVNGFTFTINGVSASTNFTGATINNSNGTTDIEINMSTGTSGYYAYFRSNTVNDNITFNLTGSYDFLEADGVSTANVYNGNATFNANSSLPLKIAYAAASSFMGNLTITRNTGGTTELFYAGAAITGNFNYTNNAGGTSVIGGHPGNKTSIGGMVNINANTPSASPFILRRISNQTTGGSIMVENSSGFNLEQDTLKLIICSIKKYFGGDYANLLNNKIVGDVAISDSSNYAGGYFTTIRNNEITGNTSFTIKGSNSLYEGDITNSGNKYFGNLLFNCEGGLMYIAYADTLTCTGNVTINRITGSNNISAFNGGGDIGGDFAYNNTFGGNTYLGNVAVTTSIGGKIDMNVNFTASYFFYMLRLINHTGGGNINVQNSAGFRLYNDTLLVSSLSLTGYRGGDYGYMFNNDITGNVIIADNVSYAGGYNTVLRNNIITGNSNFTINGSNHFFDADISSTGNKYIGNVTYNGAGAGYLYIAEADSLFCSGNLTINRTAGANTQAFNHGATINGDFTYNNSTSGNSFLGSTAYKTTIGGKTDIAVSYTTPSLFQMMRLINQTTGGIINVQNSAGFYVVNDTLKVASLSITGYKSGAFGYLFNNDITGNVTTADDASYGGGYSTSLRKNVISGNCSFSNNGANNFFDAENGGTGNKYFGNVTFNGAGTGSFYIANADSIYCSGNLTINRTTGALTSAFNGGGTINGNFAYTNSTSGHTYLGNTAYKTSIGGKADVTVNYTTPSIFQMMRLINQTTGGIIDVKNSTGFYVANDTLKVAEFSITGYKTGGYAYMLNNNITGNVTTADDITYGGSFTTVFRSNLITGNSDFSISGTNHFYDADNAETGNKYIGNVTYKGAGSGILFIAHGDSVYCNGNLIINRSGAGETVAFQGGCTINGNFSFSNLTSGNTTIGGSKKTGVGGTVNIDVNYTSPSRFQLIRLINQTAGGSINVQNSQGFYLVRDTLKVNALNITGYKQGQHAELYFNDITGDLTIADDATYGGGFGNYVRNNVITGTTNFTINSPSDLNESWSSGFGSKYNGNVSLTRNNGNIYFGNSDFTEITQNLTLNSSSGINISRIKFNGSTNGVIEQLGTQPINIPFLKMEKTGSGRLTLNDPVTITNTATFTGGSINSSATNELIFQSGTTYTGGSDASYIDGPVSKIGGSSFTFPVGNAGKFAPISITAPGVGSDAFRAQYFKANPNTAGYDTSLKDPSLHHTSSREYWKLDRTNGSSDVKVTLSWDATRSGIVNNLTELRVTRWNGNTWKDEGNGGTTGNNANGTIQTLNAVTSFSPFTLASSTALNPLPVTLLNFEGSKCNNAVCLLWSTENEQDLSHFVVEKSKNGTDFNSLINVPAVNMGQRNTYNASDNYPENGVNFYRLKIVNNNGSLSYSKIEMIDFSKPAIVSVQPNPASDMIVLKGIEGYQLVRIVDMTGSIRIQKTIQSSVQEINISSLPVGMYFIQLLNSKEKVSIKLIKQ